MLRGGLALYSFSYCLPGFCIQEWAPQSWALEAWLEAWLKLRPLSPHRRPCLTLMLVIKEQREPQELGDQFFDPWLRHQQLSSMQPGTNHFCSLIFKNELYLFLAVLGLCCCAQAISSWSKWRLLLFLHCTGFSLWWLLLLWHVGSGARELQ